MISRAILFLRLPIIARHIDHGCPSFLCVDCGAHPPEVISSNITSTSRPFFSKETGCLDLEPAVNLCRQYGYTHETLNRPEMEIFKPVHHRHRVLGHVYWYELTHTCLLLPTTVSHPLTKSVNRIASSRFPRPDAPVYARRASSKRSLPNHCYHQQPAQSTRPGVNSRCSFLRDFVRYYLEPKGPTIFGTRALSGWNCPVCNNHHMYPSL